MTPAPVEVSEEQQAAAHACLALQQGRGRRLCAWDGKSPNVHGVGCKAVARAFAERDRAAELRGADVGRRDAFLAAEQGMKDAEAAKYEPAEIARFMLDAIAARVGSLPVSARSGKP